MGRNDLCFCGSGQKQKKCHSSIKETSKLSDMYRAYYEFDLYATNSGISNNCPDDCSQCCHDFFYISENEFLLILDMIESSDQYELKKVVSEAVNYERYFKEQYPEIFSNLQTSLRKTQTIIDSQEFYDDRYDVIDLPTCLFLSDEGTCNIYSVRPNICRTYGSCLTCTKLQNRRITSTSYEKLLITSDYIISNKAGYIAKRPYPIFYWFSHFLDEDHKSSTFDKMMKIRNLSEGEYFQYTKKLSRNL